MDSGDPGSQVVSALNPVEEDLSISPGAVTLLLQQMGEIIAEGNILSSNSVTLTNVAHQVEISYLLTNHIALNTPPLWLSGLLSELTLLIDSS